MRVKYCTINGHFHPNKHSAGAGLFCRTLQKSVFKRNFQKSCLPSAPLQDWKLFMRCPCKAITTVQFHLNTETWKKIFLLEVWLNWKVKLNWQLFKVRYYEVFYITLLSWAVTSSAIRGCLHYQLCRPTQVEVWFSSWSHPTAPSDNGTMARRTALPWQDPRGYAGVLLSWFAVTLVRHMESSFQITFL